MSDGSPERGSVETAAQSFAGLLGLDEAPPAKRPEEAAAEAEQDPPDSDDDDQSPGPDEDPATGDDEAAAAPEETPAIDPPKSWSAEARARFKQLPPDLQAVVAERASEQDRTFNQRMTEVAEHRKAAEAERRATLDQRQQYARSLEIVSQVLTQAAPTPVDWDRLASEDPIAYVQARHAEDQRLSRLQAVDSERLRLHQQAALEQEAAVHQSLAGQHERMVEVIPEWRDPGRARAEKAELRAYLQSAGYSADEIGQAADHRAVVLARKAMAWDRLKAGKAVADKKVAEAPRLQKPGTRPAQSRGDERLDASQKQLRRTGNTRDAARVFERLIDQE